MIIRICNHSKLTDAQALARVSLFMSGNKKKAFENGVSIRMYEVSYKSCSHFYTVSGGMDENREADTE